MTFALLEVETTKKILQLFTLINKIQESEFKNQSNFY